MNNIVLQNWTFIYCMVSGTPTILYFSSQYKSYGIVFLKWLTYYELFFLV